MSSDLKSVLREHWITSVNCDKANGTNHATCSCSAWRGKTWTSVRAAVDEWIDHVSAHMSVPAQAVAKLPEWHTPLPWAATTRQGSWDWVIYSTKDPNIEICQLFHDGTEDNETGEANAELIVRAVNALTAQPPANVSQPPARSKLVDLVNAYLNREEAEEFMAEYDAIAAQPPAAPEGDR